mmetsp:Transcript_62335/g.140472  ORF Transcript_62335/g.140472 Transcript_62335/m.140472 type:complete len:691 (+) Transcript_62335:126-2198(+)
MGEKLTPGALRRKTLSRRRGRLFAGAEDAFRWGIILVSLLLVLGCLMTFGFVRPDLSLNPFIRVHRYCGISVFLSYEPTVYVVCYCWALVQCCFIWSAWLFYARVHGNLFSLTPSLAMLTKISAAIFCITLPCLLLALSFPPDSGKPHALDVHTYSLDLVILGFAQWFMTQLVIGGAWMPAEKNYVIWVVIGLAHIVLSVMKVIMHHTAEAEAADRHPDDLYSQLLSVPQVADILWLLTILLFQHYHVLDGFAQLSEVKVPMPKAQSGKAMSNARGSMRWDTWTQAINHDYPPYIPCPPEDIKDNRAVALAVTQAFQEAYKNSCEEAGARCPVVDVERGVTLAVLDAELSITNGIDYLHPDLRVGLFREPAAFTAQVRFNVTDVGVARVSLRVWVSTKMKLLRQESKYHASATLSEEKPRMTPRQLKSYTKLPAAEATTGTRKSRWVEDSDEDDDHFIDFFFAEELKEFFGVSAQTVTAFLTVKEGVGSLCHRLWLVLRHLDGFLKMVLYRRRYTQSIFLGNEAPVTGLFGKDYFGGLPFALGPGMCKWGLLHTTEHRSQFPGRRLEEADDMSMPEAGRAQAWLKEARSRYVSGAEDYLQDASAVFDFGVQIATDPEHRPDVPSSVWSEELSPYLPVGSLTIHSGQMLKEDAKVRGGSGWNVWNQLREHRPVGSTNCARGLIYNNRRKRD